MSLSLLLLLSLPVIYFVFKHYSREWKDIDPALLQYQSSISETRQPGESAIYRSVDVPHGTGITRGLSLRIGYKIRDGCLKDIWHIGFQSDKLTKRSITFGDVTYSIEIVNAIIHFIASKIDELETEKIAIYGDLSKNPELIFVIWACFFVCDKTVVHYRKPEDFEFKSELTTLITTPNYHSEIPANSFSNVTALLMPSVDNSDEFDHTISISSEIKPLFDYDYNPKEDFAQANNHPYSVIHSGKELKFFQINFVSAVASRLLSTPTSNTWSPDDTLLVTFYTSSNSDKSILFELCAGIMSGVSSIKVIEPKFVPNLKTLCQHNPTILITDSHSIKSMVSNNKKSFWQSFILQRSEYFNSLGYFNSFGKIDSSLNLKTAYIYQLPPLLSAATCNFCKSVLGCRVVRETHSEFTIGPILKTNIYDFRIVQNKNMQLLGIPANNVELKTIKESEEASKGRLYVRGMAIGKSDAFAYEGEAWVDTGIDGMFAHDGCFYGRV